MKKSRVISEINVTPLVDVMLVLLIIFMVAAPMMQEGIKVELPKTKGVDLAVEEEKLIVTITTNKGIFLNEQRVDLAKLGKILKKISGNRRDQEVFLRADKAVPYGKVVKIMAEIKNAGIARLGMVTDPLE